MRTDGVFGIPYISQVHVFYDFVNFLGRLTQRSRKQLPRNESIYKVSANR
jgi:hypothetical protein